MHSQGTFRAKAEELPGLGYSNSGTPYIQVVFRTAEGTITWWGYLSDAAAARTIKSLRAMGWRGNAPSEIGLSDLQSPVDLVITHEEYNGKTSAKIKWVNALGEGAAVGKPVDADGRKALDERLRALCEQTAPAAAELETPEQAAAAPKTDGGFPDDDIPFDAAG